MKMPTKKITDLLLWFSFCFLLGTGLLIHYRLIPGSQGGHGLTLFGMSRHEWGDFHLWASYIFLAALVFHLSLNFNYIKTVIAQKTNWRMAALFVLGIAIVILFLVSPISRGQNGAGNSRKHSASVPMGRGR